MVTKDNFDVDTNFHNNYKKKWGEKKGEFACWLSLELKGWTIHSQISDCKKKDKHTAPQVSIIEVL